MERHPAGLQNDGGPPAGKVSTPAPDGPLGPGARFGHRGKLMRRPVWLPDLIATVVLSIRSSPGTRGRTPGVSRA